MTDFTNLNKAAQDLIDAAVAPLNAEITELQAELAAATKPKHANPVVTISAKTHTDNPLSVDFDALVSYADGASGTKFDWDFGQSTYSGTSTAAHSYVYNKAGTYTVKLAVTDNQGGVGQATAPITLTAPVPTPTPTPAPTPTPVSNTSNGDSGVNQTGKANTQQSGTQYQSLKAGSDLTATLKTGSNTVVSLPAGTYTWNDFKYGVDGSAAASGNNASGLQLTGLKGLLGAGSAVTKLQQSAKSSSKGSTVPAQSTGSTNQLQYIDAVNLPDGFVWDGINIVGTDQSHLYNGLRLKNPGNVTMSNSTISGIPGATGSPPGETFMQNIYAQAAGKTFNIKNVTYDGKQVGGGNVGAALLGTNNTKGTINVTDVLFENAGYSAGIAIWELATGGVINLYRPVFKNNHRNIGNEAQGGTINIFNPIFGAPANGEDDIRVTWTTNFNSGPINVYFDTIDDWNAAMAGRTTKKIISIVSSKQNYGGSAGGAYTGSNKIKDFLHFFIAKKEQSLDSYWQISGS